MLISFERRFVFLHVGKAAGSAIQGALAPYAERRLHPLARQAMRMNLGRCLPVEQRMFRQHTTAKQLRRQLPRGLYDSFFSFAFVRNPWDWLVSLYAYLRRTPSHRHHARSMSCFDDYVRFELSRSRSQSSFLTDRSGRIIVDFVGRFETLEQDFATVCGTIGVEATLAHVNKSLHADYREYYSPETRDRVHERFRADIDRFGYSFDGDDVATRKRAAAAE